MSGRLSVPTLTEMNENWNSVDTAMRKFIDNLMQVQQTVAKACPTPSPVEKPVTLNVGGKVFKTFESTLTTTTSSSSGDQNAANSGGTFFSALLENKAMVQSNSDGEYFIDRSPTVFEYIIDYLRSGTTWLVLEDIPLHQRQQVLQELDFYQLPKHRILYRKLQWRDIDLKRNADVTISDPHTGTVWKLKNRAEPSPINLLCTCLHEVTHGDTVKWRMEAHRETLSSEAWWVGVANLSSRANVWLTVGVWNGVMLYDQTGQHDKGEKVFTAREKNMNVVIEFLYSRTEGTVTITIGGQSVKRRLHPEVAANPYPCVSMNSASANGSVTVEWL